MNNDTPVTKLPNTSMSAYVYENRFMDTSPIDSLHSIT